MSKIDLDLLSIEELAALRDAATEKLAEKVAARQSELEAELDKLSQYGKLTKKSLAAPALVSQRRVMKPSARTTKQRTHVTKAA